MIAPLPLFPSRPHGPLLFKGGRLFDGTSAAQEGLGLLVEGATIKAMGPVASFDGFAGQVVDTSGGTLLPGLIDCHVHVMMGGEADPRAAQAALTDSALVVRALRHAQQTLLGGFTAIRDVGGRYYLELGVRDAVNRGEQIGPTMRCAGRMICMTGGHGHWTGREADGEEDIIKAVREQVKAGTDLVKLMATGGVMTPGVNPEDAHYTESELRAGVTEAHRFRRHTASHAQGTAGILNAVRAGIDSIEHGFWITDEVVEEMVRRGTFLVPTLTAVVNIVAQKDKGIPAHAVEKASRVAEAHRNSVQKFAKAGGKIAMGTDAGTPFNRHGENGQELTHMVAIGMSPLHTLICATANGAELMRLTDRGRLAEGLAADLLVVDGDPTEDIAKAAEPRHHRMVMKDGVIVRQVG